MTLLLSTGRNTPPHTLQRPVRVLGRRLAIRERAAVVLYCPPCRLGSTTWCVCVGIPSNKFKQV
jgi:hypothetical protein